MPGTKLDKTKVIKILYLEVWLEVATLAQSGPEWEAGGELLQDGGGKMAAATLPAMQH